MESCFKWILIVLLNVFTHNGIIDSWISSLSSLFCICMTIFFYVNICQKNQAPLIRLHLFILGAIKMYMPLSCNILWAFRVSVPSAATTRSRVLCFVWVIPCFRPLSWNTREYYMKSLRLVIQIYDFSSIRTQSYNNARNKFEAGKMQFGCCCFYASRGFWTGRAYVVFKKIFVLLTVAHEEQNSSQSPV
jgi:hypothetical protein